MNPKEPLNLDDIWPQERDYVVRPERLKYVRRLKAPKKCVFCEALKNHKQPETLVVYKGSSAMVVLNKYPYNNGHILVMPLNHAGELEALSFEEHDELWFLVRESSRILKKVYTCKGLNVGINLGAAAGAGIPDHLHVHLIPRWFGDTNFFPLIAETKLIVETLSMTYKKLFKEFSKLKESSQKNKSFEGKKSEKKTKKQSEKKLDKKSNKKSGRKSDKKSEMKKDKKISSKRGL